MTFALISEAGLEGWRAAMVGWVLLGLRLGLGGLLGAVGASARACGAGDEGALKWSFPTDRGVWSSPTLGADGTVYVGSYDRKLYAVTAGGGLKWNFTTGDWLFSSPTLGVDGTVYVGSYDHKLYAICDTPSAPEPEPEPKPKPMLVPVPMLLLVVIACGVLLCVIVTICSSGCPFMHFSASSLPGSCACVVYTANTAVRLLGDCLQRASGDTCAVSPAARVAHHLMVTTWKKTSAYEFVRVQRVETLRNERLARRYHQYKWSLSDDIINIPTVGSRHAPNVANHAINSHRLAKHPGRTTVGSLEESLTHGQNRRCCGRFFRCGSDVVGNELFVFHGSAQTNYASLASEGFIKRYWRTATGAWQRFGAGFYFAPDVSKSHEYPLAEMQALPPGLHTRTMLLCKVARGRIYMTQADIPDMTGDRLKSLGYNSLHGYAGTRLNYDEFVVYEEEAILPYALVTYEFRKLGSE